MSSTVVNLIIFAIIFFTTPTITVRMALLAPPPTSWPIMEPISSPLPVAPASAGIRAWRICPPPTPPIAPAIVLPRGPRL
jgi:hypothetical protein